MQTSLYIVNSNDAILTTPKRRQIDESLLLAAETYEQVETAVCHTTDPIKSLDDIAKLSDYFISNGKYRDNMLFIVGINFGLRVSDLLSLRFGDIIDEDNCFKTTFPILESKTKNTRKKKVNRYITINEAVMDAVTLYLQHCRSRRDMYMFRSESRNGGDQNKPMDPYSVERILKAAAKECNIPGRIATHTLRKTFGYHQMAMSNNDPRKLTLLQKIFGHSSPAITLRYIGITDEEIADAYMNLNLGSKKCYDRFSVLAEKSA